MTNTATMPHQPLLFLDTNTVHFARLYLKFAVEHNLPPVGKGTSNPDDELRRFYSGRTLNDLREGLKIVEYLRKRCDSDVQIEYSLIMRLELLCGLLRGRAILDAAKAGITHRMWSRFDEHEILDRLQSNVYEKIQLDTDGLEDEFQKAGINISETNPQRMPEVWALARSILSFVFLDVGDCIVYASALLAEADELTTSDRYLRRVVNALENPGGQEPEKREHFKQARKQLLNLIAAIVSADRRHPVRLPKAPKGW